ncbi:hypothetical protein M3Y99_00153800 [Aphelenchoides fujianensis]|nr:hypothetical protein M3Y99_00153800 [Aphelenchoides fujianensis]
MTDVKDQTTPAPESDDGGADLELKNSAMSIPPCETCGMSTFVAALTHEQPPPSDALPSTDANGRSHSSSYNK